MNSVGRRMIVTKSSSDGIKKLKRGKKSIGQKTEHSTTNNSKVFHY